MEREQFTFYRSFWEALKALPKKDQLPFVMAVCSYAFGEESKSLTGQASAAFLLVKPILDKASKKAENGKRGGSKPEANRKQTSSKPEANVKQTESNIEGEKEVEVEGEVEVEIENDSLRISPPVGGDTRNAAADVLADYLDRVNPSASQASMDELRAFAETLGTAVCKRAIDIALDSKKATWPYIRAILRDKQAQGVRCLSDWERVDAERERQKQAVKPTMGQPVPADPGRIKRDMDELEKLVGGKAK